MKIGVALRLGRVSNLPTVWTNVLAGCALAGAPLSLDRLGLLLIALSLFYVAGMFLNDAFDRGWDRRFKPARPIPAGLVHASEVFSAGFALMGAGAGLLLMVGYGVPGGTGWLPLASGVVLAVAIVFYNANHKDNPLSPVVMGMCRVMVYITAGVAIASHVPVDLIAGAAVLLSYLIGLTYAAKQERLGRVANMWPLACLAVPIAYVLYLGIGTLLQLGLFLVFLSWTLRGVRLLLRRKDRDIPNAVVTLIVGISLLDALLIADAGFSNLALLACACAVLTRVLQRFVPGT